jgi:cytochrome c peroxidase
MTRKPIRVLAAIAAIVVAGFAVAVLSRSDDPPPVVATDMNHGNVRFTEGQEQRILNAIEATTESTSRDALVAEGRRIFRDSSLYEDGESCQTCHAEGSASARAGTMVHDKQAPPASPMPPTDFDGPRDPPALWGLAKTPPYFWNGDVLTVQKAVERPVMGHMSRFVTGPCRPVKGVGTVPDNPDRDPGCDAEAGRIAAQLIAYIETLDPPTTAFDQGTLSEQALEGEKIFQGKGACIECHGGPLFTDNGVHNTGVPQVDIDSPYSDRKLNCATTPGECTLDLGAPPPPVPPECTGNNPPLGCEDKPPAGTAFINTPQLRDVKNTAPYMHNGGCLSRAQEQGLVDSGVAGVRVNGQCDTLREVVEFYDSQSTIRPLNLSDGEMADLVAYLESL